MKLLLTSGGIENQSIVSALRELVGKDFAEAKLAFIPTAANTERGDKRWLIKDLSKCDKLGFQEVDIVDISAIGKDLWLPRLTAADVVFFGGGNSFHLMSHIVRSGLQQELPALLETRVYVGISAGSHIASPTLQFSSKEKRLYAEEIGSYGGDEGLGLVPFYTRAHFNSPHFPYVCDEVLKEVTKDIKEEVYAIDDATAVKVVDGAVRVVTEGTWKKYN